MDQLLIAGQKKDSYTEIHSIESITISEPGARKPKKIRDFSTVTDNLESDEAENSNLYWVARREKSLRKDVTGSDIFLVLLKEISPERLSRTLPHTQICYVQTDDFVNKFLRTRI